jgi:integrase
MQKITKHFLNGLTPRTKQYKRDKDNLSVTVNPSGKVSLAFYFHDDGKQHRFKLGSFVGTPSKDDIDSFQQEYTHLYTALANSSGLKVYDSLSERMVFGVQAFMSREYERRTGQERPGSGGEELGFGELPEEYLKREAAKKAHQEKQRRAKTFKAACIKYYEQYEQDHESVGSEGSLLKHLMNGYGKAKGLSKLEPREIKAHQIQDILDELKKDHQYAAHHVKKCASRLWRYLKRRGWVESREEVLDLDAKQPAPRTRKFSEKEIITLLDGCHPYYRAFVLNPLRLIEHTRIHWDRIDDDNNATMKVKGGGEHTQPLTNAYLACGRTTRSEGGYLLPGRHGYTQLLRTSLSDIGTKWAYAKGIEDHHNHDWRRTFASWGEKKGISYDVVDACLSHKKKGIRRVYGGYDYLAEKREALQEWSDYVESISPV